MSVYNVEDMIEVELKKPEDFLKVAETLQRIGVASKKDKTLYQSCHILHKRGKYYIVSFKELFALDGKPTDLSENDIARRNTITNLLAEWNLIKLADPERSKEPVAALNQIKILPFSEKTEWNLKSKYTIGKVKKYDNRTDS